MDEKTKLKWYPVRLYFPGDRFMGEFGHVDAIRATSYTDAIKKAAWNWDTATIIELIDESEMIFSK